MLKEIKNKQYLAGLIRKSIDNYPGGLLFSYSNGRPILVNAKMNFLVYSLTGSTVIDADKTWEDLSGSEKRITIPWLFDRYLKDTVSDNKYFDLSDGSIWRFRRQNLTSNDPGIIQTEATDITELYKLSQELYLNNQRLSSLQKRQKELLADIVDINKKKELLSTKMRIHDELGRCIIATKKSINEDTIERDLSELSDIWDNAIRNFTYIADEKDKPEISPEKELMSVAEMIGCNIIFSGIKVTEKKTLLVVCAAIREALTNAVRHAGADKLYVSSQKQGNFVHTEITSNGREGFYSIKEGDGLINLRRRVEEEGAVLNIKCDGRISLILDIPE
jgi:hypothetical protein